MYIVSREVTSPRESYKRENACKFFSIFQSVKIFKSNDALAVKAHSLYLANLLSKIHILLSC